MNTELYQKALVKATLAHAGQVRKVYGLPYICHPLAVATTLLQAGCYEVELHAAALLHDVLEDTTVTYEELRTEFGPVVADLVQELTNDPDLVKRLGKVEYTRKRFQEMSPAAVLIKLADLSCNVIDTYESRQNTELMQARWQVAQEVLGTRDLPSKFLPWITKILC